jgi:hypothetical protein
MPPSPLIPVEALPDMDLVESDIPPNGQLMRITVPEREPPNGVHQEPEGKKF